MKREVLVGIFILLGVIASCGSERNVSKNTDIIQAPSNSDLKNSLNIETLNDELKNSEIKDTLSNEREIYSCPKPVLVNVERAFSIIENNKTGLCQYLETNIVARTARNSRCEMMIHSAIRVNNQDAIDCLISKNFGVPKNEVLITDSKLNVSYLEFVIQYSNLSILKKIEFDSKMLDFYENNALMIALNSNASKDIIAYLIKYGVDVNKANKFGLTPLMVAVKNDNNIDILKILIQSGADLNAKDDDHKSVLIWAAYGASPEVIDFLLQTGADINYHNFLREVETPLITAIRYNPNLDSFIKLIEAGADYNINGMKRESAILIAIKSRQIKHFKELIKLGVDLNAQSADLNSPLHESVANDLSDYAKLLIEAGAFIDIPNKQNKSPLIVAVESNNYEMSELLVNASANVNYHQNNEWAYITALTKKNTKISNLLKKAGANLNVTSLENEPSLMIAFHNGLDVDTKIDIVNSGADVNIKLWSSDDSFALITVLKDNNDRLVEAFLKAKPNVKYIEEISGFSLLITAIKSHISTSNFKLLLQTGLSAAKKQDKISPLLALASSYDNGEIADQLILAGASPHDSYDKYTPGTPVIFIALESGNLSVVRALIKANANVNYTSIHGETLLTLAVKKYDIEMIHDLLKAGAGQHWNWTRRMPPIAIAVINERWDVVELLLKYNININSVDAVEKKTALMFAVENTATAEQIKYLIRHGADLDIKDLNGQTALMHAVYREDEAIMEVLINAGADINIKDNRYRTALYYAKMSSPAMYQILINAGATVLY